MIPIAPGLRLGRYQIRSKLGAGGMGEVYLAEDTQLGRLVAIKVLPAADQADAVARKRLIREARAAATLDHSNTCAVYEVGEAGGLAFIAMQYVEGQTLAARLSQGPLALTETLAIAVQVVDAIADAHEHGILHRDIKPANIMLTPRAQAKVMDFGLAKTGGADAGSGQAETESLLSAPGAVIGTVPYMSPEQVRGSELDRRSDLFSVGVVVYEMVSGRRPFDDSSPAATASAILTREPLPLARFAPNTPAELERIVAKALRKNPEDRYQTAKDLLVDLRAVKDEQGFQVRLERSTPPSDRSHAAVTPGVAPAARPRRRPAYVAAIVALIVLAAGGWWWKQRADLERAAAQLPRLAALAEARNYFEAYDLAITLEPQLPGDPTIAGLMGEISDTMSATSDPSGARVYLTRFVPGGAGPSDSRQLVGTTPFKNVRIARGDYVAAIELDGYAPHERTVSGLGMRTDNGLLLAGPPMQVDARLIPANATPAGMVFVPGSEYRMASWSRPTDRRVTLSDYFIDRYEVSNQDYKAFISAGGYTKREFWSHPFSKDGRTLSWDEAMALFVDQTGLPGPRQWSNQSIPEGKADYPVSDVSWYEAAAFAAFRGKQLPTVFQWEKAARDGVIGPGGTSVMPWGLFNPGDDVAHRANFGGGPWPIASGEFGMSRFGARNMAGNVAEWTLNDSSDGYLAAGGSWGEPSYMFAHFGGRPALFSSAKLGIRLAQNANGVTADQGASRLEIKQEIPEYSPTPEAKFAPLAAAYHYPPAPLDARIEETIETPDWTREKITFNGAAGERAIAYLYRPRHIQPPLQVLHYVPAGDVHYAMRPLTDSMDDRVAPFVKAGRAAFGVVLDGYIGRLRAGELTGLAGLAARNGASAEYAELTVNRIIDLRRGVDYLATRPDLDHSRIAFLGWSSGAQLGMIVAAIETRYRAVVIMSAGLPITYLPFIAHVNPINFASHIRAPKLIVQGRYDENTPLRTAAEPLFKLLPEPKRLFIYEGGHVPSVEVTMKAVSPWLDDTLGRVVR